MRPFPIKKTLDLLPEGHSIIIPTSNYAVLMRTIGAHQSRKTLKGTYTYKKVFAIIPKTEQLLVCVHITRIKEPKPCK
jgi:hypothetical protein